MLYRCLSKARPLNTHQKKHMGSLYSLLDAKPRKFRHPAITNDLNYQQRGMKIYNSHKPISACRTLTHLRSFYTMKTKRLTCLERVFETIKKIGPQVSFFRISLGIFFHKKFAKLGYKLLHFRNIRLKFLSSSLSN